MLPGLIIAVLGVGAQSQAAPPPPPTVPPLVHGYVYFDSGSSAPIRRFPIDPIAYLGPRVPSDSFVYVQGQTDTVGSQGANDALARMRAFSVADLLVLEGVDPERITIRSCGERVLNRPTPDETPEPLNRFALFDWSSQPPRASALCPVEPYRR